MAQTNIHIKIRDLTMAYGSYVIQRDLNFEIRRGDIFVIMGGSGCGKSTLLRHMIGLKEPAKGDIFFNGTNFWQSDPIDQERMKQDIGVLFQSGALWSSMTLTENIAIPLEEYTDFSNTEIREIASLKLALVGLAAVFHQKV